jgi:hypothetical protein
LEGAQALHPHRAAAAVTRQADADEGARLWLRPFC